jgi:hypothetical protein
MTPMFMTLLPLGALALNLFLVLGLFFGLNRNFWKLRGRVAKAEAASAELSAAIRDVIGKLAELEETRAVQPSSLGGAMGGTLGDGLNTTLRSKVLKMHRLGQSSDRIAGALRVPKGEVDLLLKVHRIVMRPYEEERTLVPQDVAG